MRLILPALLAASASGATAQDAGQSEALAHASQRGALLYAYDQAAWHGTDDMFAKLKDPANKIGGYIVDGPATAPRLVFFDKTGQTAVYVATFSDNRLVSGRVLGEDEDRALSPLERRMVLALGTASKAISADSTVRPCSPKPFNTVVLPPESADGPVRVYFLTPQTDTATVPFGGHYEVDVDAKGNAGSIHHFSKSCLNLPARAKTEAMFVTHLLDPVPTEVHVFNSLTLRTPIMVGTLPSKMIWTVTGDKIGAPVPFPTEP